MVTATDGVLLHLHNQFERSLAELGNEDLPTGLQTAFDYVLSNGGKRIRPALVYLAGEAIAPTIPYEKLDPPAVAVELIHVYSLIHDDLPAMDDDDLRRGRPTVHRAFDEATAILVGDGLQAYAFEVLSQATSLDADVRVAMIQTLSRAAGPSGMVGGQFVDIQATNSDLNLADLQSMHAMKTGALIQAALAMGGLASGATAAQLAALDNYGRHIGLAFQVVDDILDVEGNTAKLGKTRGKDDEANKPTYVKLMGVDGAKKEAMRLLQEANTSLETLDNGAPALRQLAHYIVERDH